MPPSFQRRGQLPGSIQPCGEITPEYLRDSSSVSVSSTAAWLMWSGFTIMCRSIIRLTTCLPSVVRPRVLQCGGGGYVGKVPPETPPRLSSVSSAVLPGWKPVKISLSCSFPVHVRALKKLPALLRLPALMTTPVVPPSKRTPVSGLSNLLSSNDERTPSLYISSSWLSTWVWLQVGWSQPRQSKGSETSISSITAILPSLITRRASNGLVTIWKKPLPGPPACASTYCWRSCRAFRPR